MADSNDGLPVSELVAYVKDGNEVQTFSTFGKGGLTGAEIIAGGNADIIVEATPTDLKDGGVGKAHVFGAIEQLFSTRRVFCLRGIYLHFDEQ